MGKMSPGKRFEGWLADSFDAAGVYNLRIPDKLYWTGQRIASEETPADFIGCYAKAPDGRLRAMLIEAKACSKHRINFKVLQDHQYRALAEFDGLHPDAHGIVALNFYDPVNVRRLNECYFVPLAVWDEYRLKDGAMKSISREECAEDARIVGCPRVGQVFDVSEMARRMSDGFEAQGA